MTLHRLYRPGCCGESTYCYTLNAQECRHGTRAVTDPNLVRPFEAATITPKTKKRLADAFDQRRLHGFCEALRIRGVDVHALAPSYFVARIAGAAFLRLPPNKVASFQKSRKPRPVKGGGGYKFKTQKNTERDNRSSEQDSRMKTLQGFPRGMDDGADDPIITNALFRLRQKYSSPSAKPVVAARCVPWRSLKSIRTSAQKPKQNAKTICAACTPDVAFSFEYERVCAWKNQAGKSAPPPRKKS